jgi:hypothetical protein
MLPLMAAQSPGIRMQSAVIADGAAAVLPHSPGNKAGMAGTGHMQEEGVRGATSSCGCTAQQQQH